MASANFYVVGVGAYVRCVCVSLSLTHAHGIRGTAKDDMDKYKAELARLRPVGSKTIETSSADQGLRGGKSPSAFKIYERNVMPRLRHAHPTKPEEELIKLCKKEWAGISEKEKRTYQVVLSLSRSRARALSHLSSNLLLIPLPRLQSSPTRLFPTTPSPPQFLAERDRERLRTQELLWRGASLGTSRHSSGENAGGHRTGERTFHTLIPQVRQTWNRSCLTRKRSLLAWEVSFGMGGVFGHGLCLF